MRRAILSVMMVLVTAATASAQRTVFVVRHAERADAGSAGAGMMANDPYLAEAGRARAESLATALKDAGITAIYTTQFKRTQQTAAPLAKALGIPVTTVSANDTAGLVEKVKSAKGNVLVVGHSNTVAEIVKALGVATPATVAEADYDNLFVVTLRDKPTLLRLHYR